MKRKVVSAITLTLLLAGTLTLAFDVQTVKASGTIYIRADGNIDPPTAAISTLDNITYVLTGDVNDSIVIERDNIIVDGALYIVEGTGSGSGITLSGRSNVTIKNMTIEAFYYGIVLDSSNNSTISGNNITNNGNGVGVYISSFNNISGNNVTANNFDGIDLGLSSSYNSIYGNNVTNNKNNGIVIGSYLNHNNNVSGNNIANNGDGISVWLSSGNSIIGNKFINNGIFVQPSSYPNSVENNTVNGRPLVYLENVSNYIIVDAGQVVLVRCFNITVEDLNLSGTDAGIELWQTNNSTISGNNMTENKLGGIFLIGSSGNSIYHNSFINNTIQVYSNGGENAWDNGYPSGGNYWSDYNGTDIRSGPYQNQTGSDGIGDTPYVIDAINKDRYPLGVFRLAGDLNGDDIVDVFDAVQAASAFGSSPGHPNWNRQADLNNDGIIDIFDLIILASNFGKRTT